jgi:hypothetical protein
MRFLRQFHVFGSTLITVTAAVLKLILGTAMMVLSAWLAYLGGAIIWTVIMAAFFIWGFVIFVRALGPLVGENNSPGRRA